MKVMSINPAGNINRQQNKTQHKKNTAYNPGFQGNVKISNNILEEVTSSMSSFRQENQEAVFNALVKLKQHFTKVGSDNLTTSIYIKDTTSIVDNGSVSLIVWGDFSPIDKNITELLKKHKYVVSPSQLKKLQNNDKYLLNRLDYGKELGGITLGSVNRDFKHFEHITPKTMDIFTDNMKLLYPEDSEAKIFKEIVHENSGFRKFINIILDI